MKNTQTQKTNYQEDFASVFEERFDLLQEDLDLKRILLPGNMNKQKIKEDIGSLLEDPQTREELTHRLSYLESARKKDKTLPHFSFTDLLQAAYLTLLVRQQEFLKEEVGKIKTFEFQYKENYFRTMGMVLLKLMESYGKTGES